MGKESSACLMKLSLTQFLMLPDGFCLFLQVPM